MRVMCHAVKASFLGPDDVVMLDCDDGEEGTKGTSYFNEFEAFVIMRCRLLAPPVPGMLIAVHDAWKHIFPGNDENCRVFSGL